MNEPVSLCATFFGRSVLHLGVFFFFFPGPVCGKLNATMKNVTLETNEVTVTFMSGPHRSGRGFLLSYATDLHPGTAVAISLFSA